jgi:hypothetical protein
MMIPQDREPYGIGDLDMTAEQLAGIATAVLGLGAVGTAIVLGSRKARFRTAGIRRLPGGLRPAKAVLAPGGEWMAVVLAGPPFESALDSLFETGLWVLLWLFPVRLCRIELWVVRSRGSGMESLPVEEALRKEPVTRRLLWRGEGGRDQAGQVEVAWTGAGRLRASFRGTVHEIEVPAGCGPAGPRHRPAIEPN